MGSLEFAVSAGQRALLLSLELALPVLAVGLIVGLVVSIFQAATQIQEQMLSFVPKILAMAGVLLLLLPWLLSVITSYTQSVLGGLSLFGSS